MVYLSSIVSSVLLAATTVVGHSGSAPMSVAEVSRRTEPQRSATRSLGACQDVLSRRNKAEKSSTRRAALADELRRKRGLATRAPYNRELAHLSREADLTIESASFGGLSVVTPEIERGMLYVAGEYVRSTVSEDQQGIYTYVDLEVIDVSNCSALPNMYVDFWHCNSTGVYAGVLESGNGDSSDLSNLDKTFLRGIQRTNEEGHASFETIFPGHYSGRATHFNTVIHSSGTLFDNGTFTAPREHLIGQIFVDQDLILIVEATSPYNTNTIEITTNSIDQMFGMIPGHPVLEYILLGDDISDGLLLWGTIGVNMSASYEIPPAATLTGNGGVIYDPSSAGQGNTTSDGAASGNSTTGDGSADSTSSSGNSTTLLHGDLFCTCTDRKSVV